jgi:hypothetical protein
MSNGFVLSRYGGPNPDGPAPAPAPAATAQWESLGLDWRVRLHLPNIDSFSSSPIFAPLVESGNSMVFPVIPQVMVSHSASYNALAPTHSNYSFPIYSNSQVEDITILGRFPVENEADGRYWVSTVHFLRSITKMFYGNSESNLGAPPPLVHLSGYGDFVLNKIPGVIKLFTLDMPSDVDYIRVPLSEDSSGFSYVPVLSTISVTFSPTYSRDQVRQFSLDSFVRGEYIGTERGFI